MVYKHNILNKLWQLLASRVLCLAGRLALMMPFYRNSNGKGLITPSERESDIDTRYVLLISFPPFAPSYHKYQVNKLFSLSHLPVWTVFVIGQLIFNTWRIQGEYYMLNSHVDPGFCYVLEFLSHLHSPLLALDSDYHSNCLSFWQ